MPTGTGYQVFPNEYEATDTIEIAEGDSFGFSLEFEEGYKKGDTFAVKANGTKLVERNGSYIITNIRANQTITIENVVEQDITPKPLIKFEETPYGVVITAEGEGDVTLYVNRKAVSNPYTISKEDVEMQYSVYATARGDDKLISDTVRLESGELYSPAENADNGKLDISMIDAEIITVDPRGISIGGNVSGVDGERSVKIELYKEGTATAAYQTSILGSGEYILKGIARGTYTMKVTANGYAEYTATINVTDVNIEHNVSLKKKDPPAGGYPIGDVDLDGKVSTVDSNLLKRVVAGIYFLNEGSIEAENADVDGDGKITTVDSNLLKRIVAGIYRP